jgi:hypothetical protein
LCACFGRAQVSVANMARITPALGAAHNIRPRSQKLHSADQHQFTFLFLDLHIFVYFSHNCASSDLDHVPFLSLSLQLPTLIFQVSNLLLYVTINPGFPTFAIRLNNQGQWANMDRIRFLLIKFEHLATLNDLSPTL